MNILLGVTPLHRPVKCDGRPNLHLTITGDSGSGKTYFLKRVIPRAVAEGAKVVVFDTQGDFSNVSADYFSEWYACKPQVIDIRDVNYGLNLFTSISQEEEPYDIVLRLCSWLKTAMKLNKSQSLLLCNVLEREVMAQPVFTFSNLVSVVTHDALENRVAESLRQELSFIRHVIPAGAVPIPWNQEKAGLIIVKLHGIYDVSLQSTLLEMLMVDCVGDRMAQEPETGNPLILVFDECQLLRFDDRSMASRILRMGRKYRVFGWFSTQWIKGFKVDILGQAGMKIFFRSQTSTDTLKTAITQLGVENHAEKQQWKKKISELKVGQFVVRGPNGIYICSSCDD